MAVLHDIQTPPSFFLTASFAAGDKLVRAQKYIQIVEYPTNTVFGKKRTWAVSDITVNATNIETPSRRKTFLETPEPNDPPWLRVALAEVGVTRKTRRGKQSADSGINASTTLGPLSDKTPWGCSFVSWVFQQSQTKGNLRSARCVDWLRFGSPIADAKRGAVAIFSPIVSEATS